MLINIAKTDFGIPDKEDDELSAIHDAFGHSQVVGELHYGLQATNALAELSHTAVSSMQRVSLRWHDTIGQKPNTEPLPSDVSSAVQMDRQIDERHAEMLRAMVNTSVEQSVASMGSDFVAEFRAFAQSLGNGIISGINDVLQANNARLPGMYILSFSINLSLIPVFR